MIGDSFLSRTYLWLAFCCDLIVVIQMQQKSQWNAEGITGQFAGEGRAV